MNDQLTESEYLQLIGLYTLAKQYQSKLSDLETAINNVIDATDEKDKRDVADHVQDSIYGYPNVDPVQSVNDVLKRIGIKRAGE
ncbi:MAG TPA: hypothetical protein VEF04_04705 [Blastocatellia bacterium]|nr:hypothetical protein [Blastocatellia bacterium]